LQTSLQVETAEYNRTLNRSTCASLPARRDFVVQIALKSLKISYRAPLGVDGTARSMPEHVKKKLLEEIKALEHELTHELPKEIKKAAALGDLSENAEYHMAKQRQEFVNARLGQLKKRMGDLALVNLSNIPKDRIAFGSIIQVFDTTKDEKIEYTLVTSEESDVTKGKISTTSPIGKSLMGKKVGDVVEVVTPTGKRELEILKLATIHDQEAAESNGASGGH
jgi:transcription elongation factor GreA